MEIYINRQSGKSFVFLEEVGTNTMLLITPDGEIKTLKNHLFDEPIEEDEDSLLFRNVITTEQLDKYQTYQRRKKEALVESWDLLLGELFPSGRRGFIRDLDLMIARRRKLMEE